MNPEGKMQQPNTKSAPDFIVMDEILFGNDDDADTMLENQVVEDFLFDDNRFGF